jgi:hypothetical protein
MNPEEQIRRLTAILGLMRWLVFILFPASIGVLLWFGVLFIGPRDRFVRVERKVDTLQLQVTSLDSTLGIASIYLRALALARCKDESLTPRELDFLNLPCDELARRFNMPGRLPVPSAGERKLP